VSDQTDPAGGPADDEGPTDADRSSDADEGTDADRSSGGRWGGAERRHERLQRHPTPGPRNSLQSWTDHRSPLVVARNYALIWLVRISPSLRLKNRLLRAIGVTVGEGVSWGLEATPDVFWPNLITLGDDVIIGYDSTLLCHEFLQDEYRTGEVRVGDRAMIGAGAVVLPGVEIGADAQVAANSLVTEDVPPGATVAGVPAEVVSAPSDDE
jgi:acetyltransferase-like isoleucine patch superfamily enzyme